MHNVSTWDHRSPSELRAVARRELLTRYDTIQIQNTYIQQVRKTTEGNFEAIDSTGKVWEGRKLVLAVGARDIPPDIPGYAAAWGKKM
jgi:thioredoxin reductase